jgi:hypothetical protein
MSSQDAIYIFISLIPLSVSVLVQSSHNFTESMLVVSFRYSIKFGILLILWKVQYRYRFIIPELIRRREIFMLVVPFLTFPLFVLFP